jgi:hypothetical protein
MLGGHVVGPSILLRPRKRDEEQRQRDEALRLEIQLLRQTNSAETSKTAGVFGQSALTSLDAASDTRTTRVGKDGHTGDPVLTKEEATVAAQFKDEKLLDVFLTAKLTHIFSSEQGWVVCNSEDFPWLQVDPNPKFNQKPDFFVCHPLCVLQKFPKTKNKALSKARAQADLFFGVPDHRKLHDMLFVLESKLKITNTALGEVLAYHEYVRCDKETTTLHMLFDKNEFWLLAIEKRVVTKRVICEWTTAGSVALIREFFSPPPWHNALHNACEALDIVTVPGTTPQPFLGAGGSGRVFRLSSNHALKVVLPNNRFQLKKEYTLLKKHRQLPNLVNIFGPFAAGDDWGAAYIMYPSGSRVAAHDNNLEDIFASLRALHQGGLAHGDARLANIIQHDGAYIWVDVREALDQDQGSESAAFVADVAMLATSWFGPNYIVGHDPEFMAAANKYGDNVNSDADFAHLIGCLAAKTAV